MVTLVFRVFYTFSNKRSYPIYLKVTPRPLYNIDSGLWRILKVIDMLNLEKRGRGTLNTAPEKIS